MTTQNKDSRAFRFYAKHRFFELLEDVANKKGMTMSEALRFGFDNFYHNTFRKETYGYQAGSETSKTRLGLSGKKQAIESKIEELKNMTDEMLTSYLRGVSYIDPDGYMPDNENVIVRKFIGLDQEGVRSLMEVQEFQGKESYRTRLMTIDELIVDLRKRKLL